MAELPAEDGAAGQGQPDGIGPEGERSLLVVSPQDDPFPSVKANGTHMGAGNRLGWGLLLLTLVTKETHTQGPTGTGITGTMLHSQIKSHFFSYPVAGHTGALCISLPKKCNVLALLLSASPLMDEPTRCQPPAKLCVGLLSPIAPAPQSESSHSISSAPFR